MRVRWMAAVVAAAGVAGAATGAGADIKREWPGVGPWHVSLNDAADGAQFCALIYGPAPQASGRDVALTIVIARDWSNMRVSEDGPAREHVDRLQFTSPGFQVDASVLKVSTSKLMTHYTVNLEDIPDLSAMMVGLKKGGALFVRGGDANWVFSLDRLAEADAPLRECTRLLPPLAPAPSASPKKP